MKKRLFAALLLIMILSVVVENTAAYFSASTEVHNVITTGAIDIALKETTLGENQEEIPYPEDPVVGVMPGQEHSKIVRIQNVCDQPAWVRIRVETTITDAAGNDLPADQVGIQFDETLWVEEDGYFYYKTELAPGEETEPLFRTVRFDSEMGNAYQEATVEIDVIAQAVQSANNGIPAEPADADVTDVKGWPVTEP